MSQGPDRTQGPDGRKVRTASAPRSPSNAALGNPEDLQPHGSANPPTTPKRRSASSKASSKSSSASVKRKEVELDAKKKLREYKKAVYDKEEALLKLQFQLTSINESIDSLLVKEGLELPDRDVDILHDQKAKLLTSIKMAQAELDSAKKHLLVEEDIVDCEKDLELKKIDEEESDDYEDYDTGEDIGADDGQVEKGERVEQWLTGASGENNGESGLQQQGKSLTQSDPPGFTEKPPQHSQSTPEVQQTHSATHKQQRHVDAQQQPTWGPAGPSNANASSFPSDMSTQPLGAPPTVSFSQDPGQPRDQAQQFSASQLTHGVPLGYPPFMQTFHGGQPPTRPPLSTPTHGVSGPPPTRPSFPRPELAARSYPHTGPPFGPPPLQQPPAQQQFQQFGAPQFMQPPPQQASGDAVSMRDLVNALHCVAAPRTPAFVDRDLPTFGGRPEDWLGFKSHYLRTTQEYRLTHSDNLQRLRKALKGGAMESVKFLFNTPDNVPEIMNTLEFEYGRVELIIKSLITNAETTPKPDINKPESVIVFARAVQSLVSTIKNHGQHGYMDGRYLLDKLVDRLPINMQRNWRMFAMQENRGETLQAFLDFVLFEKAMATVSTTPASTKTGDGTAEVKRRRGQGSVNTTSKEEKCLWCDEGGHQTQKCKKGEMMTVDERWTCAKKKKVCISCLKSGHRPRECKSGKVCGIDDCKYVHHKLLHSSSKKSSQPPRSNQQRKDSSPPRSERPRNDDAAPVVRADGSENFISGCDGPLPILQIKIKGPEGVIKTYALLDTGATCSLISKTLANELGLPGEEFSYSYRGAGGRKTDPKARPVSCEVAGVFRGSTFKHVRGLIAIDDLPTHPYSVDVDAMKAKWPHLQQVKAKSLEMVVPQIIIGNNNPHLILPRELVSARDEDPWGWRTPLGWTISGNFYGNEGSVNVLFGNNYPSNDYLHQLIKSSFSVDSLGVKVTTTKGMNMEERRAREILEQTTKKVGTNWEVGLLWREDHVSFPDSMASSLDRLVRNEKRMNRDPQFKAAYIAQVQDFVNKGYARKLTSEEAAVWTPSTYVIPTFGVLNPNKPGKFRLVMDAKSKCHGVSLNDKLLKGPDLIRPLTAILWIWRTHPVALTGDIRDMFLRVGMRPEDRDSQRFLWRDGNSSRAPDHYRMECLIFGATSSPASAIFVKDRNAETFQDIYPKAVQVIKSQFYLDDCICGGDTVEEVVELRRQINEICSAGNFEVIKWLSNSTAVLESIPEDMRAAGVKTLADKEEYEGDRVLGLWWDPNTDTFQFRLGLHKVKKSVLDGEIPTKREMCGLVMSLFDPIGFIAHYKVKGQILLQQVWNAGVGWDDEIPTDIYTRWRSWLTRLPELSEVQVPRHYFGGCILNKNVELHVFVDASSEAYSAVCYFRSQKQDNVVVSFVAGKARVAPLKKTTIPRLELLGALMGARLAVSIGEELGVNKMTFWSDSTTVLQWLRSPAAKLKEFVANRIGEIQEVTNVSDWRWIPTKLNVADLATLWESDCSFSPEFAWFTGPAFLKEPHETWKFEQRHIKEESQPEDGMVNIILTNNRVDKKFAVPDATKFSSFFRLQRCTAGLLRFQRYLKNPAIGKPWFRKEDGSIGSRIEAEDMRGAEILLCRQAQQSAFPADMAALMEGKTVDNKSQLWRLSPKLDQTRGVIVMDGRIKKADGVPEEMKNPIILPSHHPIIDLIIDLEHRRNAHQGAKTIQANLQQKYWIIAAGHAVNRSFARCWKCKIKRAKPVNPQMAVLPPFRLAHQQPAFSNVGIDLFGPLCVTVGRRHEKRWGVVVCCMTTRAVYLDLVYDLSTDELIMTISRFVDTRIRPSLIVCDNGTNLVGAGRKMKEAWKAIDLDKLRSYGKFSEISWSFNTPAAPHMGGAWESMVKLSKKCLESVLLEKAPKDSTLLTMLKGAESILNSRPLTALSNDPADAMPLTPNHFIRGTCDVGPAIPAGVEEGAVLREKWRRAQQLQQLFWERWRREFLPKLIKREKWYAPVKPLQLGEIVTIMEDNAPVKCWKRGFISKLFPSGDGQVRSVEISSRDFTTKKITVTKRPVVKVISLGLYKEIRAPEDPNLGASVNICSASTLQMSHVGPVDHATDFAEQCSQEEGKD